MQYIKLVPAFVVATALTLACASPETAAAPEPKQNSPAELQLEKANTESKEAVHKMQAYAYAQKADFIKQTKEDLTQIQKEMDLLGAKVAKADDAVKADANSKLDAVREKWAQAKMQLDRAEDATEATWDDVTDGVKKSYGEMQDAYEQTRQWLSDKIEPN